MCRSDDDTMWAKLHVLAEVASVFHDEFLRSKKGKSKMVDYQEDEEDQEALERLFGSVPRKARSQSLVYHGPSTTCSSLLLPDLNKTPPRNPSPYDPSLSRFFFAHESCGSKASSSRVFHTEMKNPSSQFSLPPSVTEQRKSRKRPALKQKTRPGNSKKAKTDVHLSWKGRGTPESLLWVMEKLDAADQEPKLIFERTLYKTDVNPGESRLSMPITQIISNEFLTSDEKKILKQDIDKANKVGVEAYLVNEKAQTWRVYLKRWESSNSTRWSYSVTYGWNDFVEANRLREDQGISVWTFRSRDGVLFFAIIAPPQE